MATYLKTQILIVACVNIGQFIDGYSVGWSAPIIPKLQDKDQTPLPELITDFQAAFIGSLLYIGAIVGPYIPSYLSNIVGRKPCLFLGGLLNLLAIVLIITTKNISMVYAIRIISGLGMGMVTVSNLVYVGEIASTNIRGILLTSTSIVGISGTLAAYCIGPFVSYAATGYIALVVNIVHVIGILFIPESPVYYAIKGKEMEAKETLRYLGRLDDLDSVFESVQGTNPNEGHSWKAWIKIFTVKANRWSLFITLSLCTLQQTSGVAAVLFFATTIFQLAGSSIRPDIATIIVGATRLIASLIAPAVVERAGRRILLLVSTAFCAISLSILGAFFCLVRVESPVVKDIGWLPLLAFIMYFSSYEIGFGTMPSALVGEMFRGNARSTGSAVAMTTAWLIGFGVAGSFGSMLHYLGGDVTFWIFALSCICAFLFTFKFVPETKGRTLNEIQEILVYLGCLLGGYNGGWSAPSIPVLIDPKQTPLPEALSDTQASWVASVTFIGIVIGPNIAGYVSNVIGRRWCFIFSGVLSTISIAMMLVPMNLSMMIFDRILIGFAVGIMFTLGVIYLGEIASTNTRGIVLSGATVSSSFGTLLVFCVGAYVSYEVCLAVALVISIVFTIGCFYIPESPTFQMLKGDAKQVSDILTSLGRVEDIQSILASHPSEPNQIKELFTVKSNRRALFITITLSVLQHCSGASSIIFFSTTIFGLVGESIDSNISTIAIGLTMLISSSFTSAFVESCGRRILLLLSTAVCFLTLALLGAYFYIDKVEHSLTQQLNWLPLASLVIFILSFNVGFGPISITLMGEMFEPNLRSIGTSIAFTVGYCSAFVVSSLFGYMMTLGAHFTFWFFATSCALGFITTIIFVPETKGKTLAEIQYILSK